MATKEKETKYAESIREKYTPKEESKLEKLRALDKKVSRPAEIFAYSFGVAGALVLGVGMCLAMGVIGNLPMPVSVIIGCAGIAICGVNYPIYKGILNYRKQKYAKEVFELTDELING